MADIRTPELLRRALNAIAFIRGTGMANMPPDPKLTALLVDALCFCNGFSNRDEAWRAIGVSPATGKGYLHRHHQNLTWPVWFTLRHTALGE